MDERTGIHEMERRDETEMVRPTETWRLLAEQLEPRIEELTRTVEGLRAAPYYVWLADSAHLCDPVNDLRVKVEALRWMFRIAKHLKDGAREMVMATVSKSVDDLEIAVEAQLHVNAVRHAA